MRQNLADAPRQVKKKSGHDLQRDYIGQTMTKAKKSSLKALEGRVRKLENSADAALEFTEANVKFLMMLTKAVLPASQTETMNEIFEAVEATSYTRRKLGYTLQSARIEAKLSREDLAKKMGPIGMKFNFKDLPECAWASVDTIREVEEGRRSAGERYVAVVLKACGLPKNWKP